MIDLNVEMMEITMAPKFPPSSQIIVFPARARPGGVRCEAIGVTFPIVYRVEGFSFREDGVTRGAKALLHYTLSQDDACGLTDCRWQTIESLDPWKDAVSLAIRHHPNRDRAYGYIDALMDLRRQEGHVGGSLFETPLGLFTLTAVTTEPWWPGPLMIYGAEVPARPGGPFDSDCWTQIVDNSGSHLDETILWPPENAGP
ncbi:hypothetical protein HY633_01435 [Candidatus Uhrbacteria bacterium]|nr:hypothetical protein [Candidatus Uhrbacteria bacterium]